MSQPIARRIGLYAFFLCLTLLYAAAIQAYYVGFFNDDAYFIFGARSLLKGAFLELNHPLQPPLISYMPGYPLLLTIVAAFHPSSFVPYQILAIVLTIMSVGLAFVLFRKEIDPLVTVVVVVMTALNPLMISLSGAVLSDIPYLLFTLLFFMAWMKYGEQTSIRSASFLTFLAVAAFYMRPIGLILLIILIGRYLVLKKYRLVLVCLAISIAVISPFLIRNYLAKGQWLSYGSQYLSPFQMPFTYFEHLKYFVLNLLTYLRELFAVVLFRWPLPGSNSVWEIVVPLLSCGCVAIGFAVSKKDSFWTVMKLYLLGYFIVIALWRVHASRYLLPVVPMVGLFFGFGVWRILSGFKYKNAAMGGVICLSVLFFIKPAVRIIHASLYETNRLNYPAQNTLNWVKTNTKKEDIFAARLEASWSLLTGRPTVALTGRFPDTAIWAQSNNVSYVVEESFSMPLKTREEIQKEKLNPQDDSPRFVWPVVYENRHEGTRIYRVVY